MADKLPYKIVAIDGAHDELLGRTATLILARALYRAAISSLSETRDRVAAGCPHSRT